MNTQKLEFKLEQAALSLNNITTEISSRIVEIEKSRPTMLASEFASIVACSYHQFSQMSLLLEKMLPLLPQSGATLCLLSYYSDKSKTRSQAAAVSEFQPQLGSMTLLYPSAKSSCPFIANCQPGFKPRQHPTVCCDSQQANFIRSHGCGRVAFAYILRASTTRVSTRRTCTTNDDELSPADGCFTQQHRPQASSAATTTST